MKSEAAVLNDIRLEASRRGWRLWRNNSGAYQDPTGRLVRYGLANESTGLNRVIKSADLIGVRPHLITVADLGRTVGVFASVEVKAEGWTGPRDDHERAQMAWAELIQSLGGYAVISGDAREIFKI